MMCFNCHMLMTYPKFTRRARFDVKTGSWSQIDEQHFCNTTCMIQFIKYEKGKWPWRSDHERKTILAKLKKENKQWYDLKEKKR